MRKQYTKALREVIILIAKDTTIQCDPLPSEFWGYGLDGFEKGKHVTVGNLANELRRNCMALNGSWLVEEEDNAFFYFEKAGFHIVNWKD